MAVVATRNSASRFFNLPLIQFRDRYAPEIASFVVPESNAQDTTIAVTRPNRLDLIAEKVYRDPNLYWILAIANNIADPMNVPEGTILRVPSFDFISAFTLARG